MKVYYIYDEDNYRRPKHLFRRNWCGEVIEEVDNQFKSKEEAEHWCWVYNKNYISRVPYKVCEEEI